MLVDAYPGRVLSFDEHTSQYFSNQYTTARATWYGVSGVPDVYFDGGAHVVGGGSGSGACLAMYQTYLPIYTSIMNECGGMSPVGIEGTFTINGLTATLTATFVLVEPVDVGTVRAAFFLSEDGLVYSSQTWNHITRVIEYANVTGLNEVGDEVTVVKQITLNSAWVPANLNAAVALESPTNPKGMVQASALPAELDYSLSLPVRLASLPAGNGEAEFAGSLWNLSDVADEFTVTAMTESGWTAEFQVEGDPAWYSSHATTLAADEFKGLTLRVHTDGVRQIGETTLRVVSADSGREQDVVVRIFNAGYAILLVDDDDNTAYEVPFEQALTNLGLLFDNWDGYYEHGGTTPSAAKMMGYDAVIWQTGYRTSGTVTDADKVKLMAYLDQGGALFLSSMDFLSSQTSVDEFISDYLGVSAFQNNTRSSEEFGVPGDPITDGMHLVLSWPASNANRTDTVQPTASSHIILNNELGVPNAVRLDAGTYRTVFCTVGHDGIYRGSAAASEELISQVVDWLLESDPGSAEDPAATTARILWAAPNPFRPATELGFSLSPAAAAEPVRLALIGPDGRVVRTLVDGRMEAGMHRILWDGRDAQGREMPTGVVFGRLETADGTSTTKLIRVR